MSESLNVIALISGGKDSLYSLLHCLENGHKVVALANLYPPSRSPSRHKNGNNTSSRPDSEGEGEGEDEDLNSFMYQTVGYSIIPLYADCLGLPLYRREIRGSAVQTGRYYDASNLAIGPGVASDETEDLVPLLQEVLRNHPKANALCSGAILSTYQRTRVESIAIRLGLTPLAYLWQYPALPPPSGRDDSLTGLLDDMAAAGCDARIIKIASGGIKESLLWSNVADSRTRSRLVAGLRPFFPDQEFELRGAVLGEGGEYETLAINGPTRLWKKRIAISEENSSAFAGDGGVSYLRIAGARTVRNEPESNDLEEAVRIPRLLDPQFEAVRTKVHSLPTSASNDGKEHGIQTGSDHPSMPVLRLAQNLTSQTLAMSNITAETSTSERVTGTPVDQVKQICKNLVSLLDAISSSHGRSDMLTPSNIIFTTLLLTDMSQFGAVNAVYSTLFRPGEPNPPARVTVACDLPAGVEVSLNVILDLRSREARRGLHVQSRSYWAPANIGPYSQAICVPLDPRQDGSTHVNDAGQMQTVHIAGQIPLIPQSMKTATGSFLDQAVLSLQHLWRIGQERGVDAWPWGVAFLQHSQQVPIYADEACRVWQQAYRIGTTPRQSSSTTDQDENDDGPDAWDRQYNRFTKYETTVPEVTVGGHLHQLPNLQVLQETCFEQRFVPSFIAAEVVALPRDAGIEWWSLGLANLPQFAHSVPRITMHRQQYSWGSACRVSVRPWVREREQQEEQEQTLTSSADANTHFVTVLIQAAAMDRGSGAIDSKTVGQDLTQFLCSGTGEMASASLQVVHGTAFISSRYQTQWVGMQQQALFADLAIITCKSIHGCSGVLSSEASNPSEQHKTQSGEDSAPTMQKHTKLDSPTDPYLSKQSTAQEASSMCTAFKPGAIAAQSCQPLAAALTMRIDNHVC